jgi:hypothetical protein
MTRRCFLWLTGSSSTVLLASGAWWARTTFARNKLKERLLSEALPVLARKADDELGRLPDQAKERIKTWFHAPCLNAGEFAREICSLAFLERLRAANPELRVQYIANAFVASVVSGTEIRNFVQIIAQEVGSCLDRNWADCCRQLAASWNLHLQPCGSTLPSDFAGGLDDLIRERLQQAVRAARIAGELPSVGETADEIGRTAILLLRFARLRIPHMQAVLIPTFVLAALRPLVFFVMSRINNPAAEIQAAVGDRLALLANEIGAEFKVHVRSRIAQLHEWQLGALEAAAHRLADDTIALL